MDTAGITLLDGGMGKTLEKNGAPFRQPEWSALALIEDPPSVSHAHEQFVAAGADVITTNNYAVVPFHLGDERFATDGARLTGLSGSLARAAAGPDVRVAGSIPPLYGSYEPDKFNAETAPAHLRVIVDALAPHVDFFLCETQSSTTEAAISLQAAAPFGLPCWVSYTLDDDLPDTPQLRSGESLGDAIETAQHNGAEAVLFNCSQPEVLANAIPAAVALADGLEIGGYANSFVPKPKVYAANEVILDHRSDLDPDGYLRFVEQWVADGATIVGGCCGIMPPHIALLRSELEKA